MPNRLTREGREAFREFIDGNVDRMQGLFDRVARRNPSKALELIASLAEFCIPKLQRTEFQMAPAFVAHVTVSDPVEAARVYEQVMGGALALDAVRFEPMPIASATSEHGVPSEPIAPSPSGHAAQASAPLIERQLASPNGVRDG